MGQNKRVWLVAALAVLGIVYSVLATRWWVMSWLSLPPLMHEIPFGRQLLGPFWFAIELAPITMALVLLRVNPGYAAFTILFYEIIMNAAEVVFEPIYGGGYRLHVGMIVAFPFNYALQLPVWGLTWLAVRAVRSVKT